MGLEKAQLYEDRVREYQQNQLLLTLAKSLFQEQTSLDRLITNIIVEAKKMLNCERCTIFLLDLKMYDQIEQDAWNIKESLALLASTAASNSVSNVNTASGRFVPGDLTVSEKSYDILVTFLPGESLLLIIEKEIRILSFSSYIISQKRNNSHFQDDTSSQTSVRDYKEEDLHFKVAYELNDEENETVRFDCDK